MNESAEDSATNYDLGGKPGGGCGTGWGIAWKGPSPFSLLDPALLPDARP